MNLEGFHLPRQAIGTAASAEWPPNRRRGGKAGHAAMVISRLLLVGDGDIDGSGVVLSLNPPPVVVVDGSSSQS
ncbi:hypothetical protein M0802_007396 [Mischocyttarus mexicanus]|nr:hypothetical protein M0802_007396 [Mischocyttarus mexicanus]